MKFTQEKQHAINNSSQYLLSSIPISINMDVILISQSDHLQFLDMNDSQLRLKSESK